MQVPKEAWPAVAAVVAALLAAFVSFIVAVLSKEQKTSEFRQAWIDSLREDLAQFGSLILVVHDTIQSRLKHGETLPEIQKALVGTDMSDYKLVEAARLRLLFRLNPIEHIDLIGAINAAYEHTPETEQATPGKGDKLSAEFTRESQRVLKAEWQRVKRGEPTFQATKWGALALAISLAGC